jgi:hypothetical protein
MIENKYLLVDPHYYIKWDNFKKIYFKEAEFICSQFMVLCKKQKTIYGRIEIKSIIDNELFIKFPEMKNKFENDTELGEILGIGLWNCIDSDTVKWFWSNDTNYYGEFLSKIYARH